MADRKRRVPAMGENSEGLWTLLAVAFALAVGLAVLGLIALAVSFVMPVDMLVGLLAVLTGLVVESRLLEVDGLLPDSDKGTTAVQLGAGAVWILGVFLAGAVLGPGVVLVGVVLAALGVVIWILNRAGPWLEARRAAADRADPGSAVARRLSGDANAYIVRRAWYVAGEGLVVVVKPGVSPEEARRFGCNVVVGDLRAKGLPATFQIRDVRDSVLASDLSPCS